MWYTTRRGWCLCTLIICYTCIMNMIMHTFFFMKEYILNLYQFFRAKLKLLFGTKYSEADYSCLPNPPTENDNHRWTFISTLSINRLILKISLCHLNFVFLSMVWVWGELKLNLSNKSQFGLHYFIKWSISETRFLLLTGQTGGT